MKILTSVLCLLLIGIGIVYHFVTYTPYGRIDFSSAIILRIVNSFGSEKSAFDYTPEEFRETMDGILIRSQRKPEPIYHFEDKKVEWAAGFVPVRIYRPSLNEKLPVILYFHGGGWVSGSIVTHDNFCRRLAKVSSTVVVSVEYSLAPEVKFPIPLEQGYAVLQWLAAGESGLDIDEHKIVLAGDSAGATIAASISMMARDRNGPGIRSQILLYPVTDLSGFKTESHMNFGTGYFLSTESLDWMRGLYLTKPDEAKNPLVSPLLAERHNNLPPALVVTAQFDPLSSEGRAYAQKLKAAGNDCRYVHMPGVLHGFAQSRSKKSNNVLNMIAEICAGL